MNDIFSTLFAIRVLSATVFGGLLLACPPWAAAQEPSPWSAKYLAERASVTDGSTHEAWNTDQLLLTWTNPAEGGWQGSVERYQRPGMIDVAMSSRAYKRAGEWTFAGGASGSRAPHFIYRFLTEVEVSRRVAGTVVATGGYRFLSYPALSVHQVVPAVTWYYASGEAGARWFITRNATTNLTTNAVAIHAIRDLTSRVRLSAGLSGGTRIFDVVPLAASADSVVGFGLVRIGVTSRDFIEAGTTAARELPDFSYRSVILTYRRVF